MILLLPFR